MLRQRIGKVAIICAAIATTLACWFAALDHDVNVRLQLIVDGVPFARLVPATAANSRRPYAIMASDYVFSGKAQIGLVDMGGGVELDDEIAHWSSSADGQIELIEVLAWISFASAAFALIATVYWAPQVILRFPFKREVAAR